MGNAHLNLDLAVRISRSLVRHAPRHGVRLPLTEHDSVDGRVLAIEFLDAVEERREGGYVGLLVPDAVPIRPLPGGALSGIGTICLPKEGRPLEQGTISVAVASGPSARKGTTSSSASSRGPR